MDFSPLMFSLPFLSMAGWVAASIVYRRQAGKPIFPRAPAGAVFVEAWSSGRSLKNPLTRIGGASGCLLVYVADGALTVIPIFPFNLMFLPEVYGLEAKIPINNLTVRTKRGLFGDRLLLIPGEGGSAPIELSIRDRQGLVDALDRGRSSPRAAPREPGSAPRRRKWAGLYFRLFAGVWGAVALTIAGSGLRQDILFRMYGATATARFVEPTGEPEPRNGAGILAYKVDGQVYKVTSIWGAGLYRIGQPGTVRYMPSDPPDAREEDCLGFDVLFCGLAVIMLTLSITLGRISRAFNRSIGAG